MSQHTKLINIPYLEGSDLTPDGKIKNLDKPAIVMVYGQFCPHCTKALPNFQQLASLKQKVFVCAAQTDDPQSGDAAQAIQQAVGQRGVPTFVGFKKNGQIVMYNGDRSANSLVEFALNL